MAVQVKKVALMLAGMEIGCALNVNSALPMNVFTNTVTFTNNMYRDTFKKQTLSPESIYKNKINTACEDIPVCHSNSQKCP